MATHCSAAGLAPPAAATHDEPTILATLRNVLLELPDHTVVHTGHGDSTTVGAERAGVLARAAELNL